MPSHSHYANIPAGTMRMPFHYFPHTTSAPNATKPRPLFAACRRMVAYRRLPVRDGSPKHRAACTGDSTYHLPADARGCGAHAATFAAHTTAHTGIVEEGLLSRAPRRTLPSRTSHYRASAPPRLALMMFTHTHAAGNRARSAAAYDYTRADCSALVCTILAGWTPSPTPPPPPYPSLTVQALLRLRHDAAEQLPRWTSFHSNSRKNNDVDSRTRWLRTPRHCGILNRAALSAAVCMCRSFLLLLAVAF